MKAPGGITPSQVFESIWAGRLSDPGYVPYEIPSVKAAVLNLVGNATNQAILEVGCGSGVVSLALAQSGARCTLLDLSSSALVLSKALFARVGCKAHFVRGNMFRMPFPGKYYDVVWSSGVLEHFEAEKTYEALCEMGRVTRVGGKLISLVPSSRALFYRLGKFWQERKHIWRYGYERPIRTLSDSCPPGFELDREFQVGVSEQANFLPAPLRKYVRFGLRLICSDDDSNQAVATVLGGYLLVTVFSRVR